MNTGETSGHPETVLWKVRAWVWLDFLNVTFTVSVCLPGEIEISLSYCLPLRIVLPLIR